MLQNKFKKMLDLYTRNDKTLVKVIKQYPNKWKDILCSYIGRLNIVQKTIFPHVIFRLNSISIKIPMVILQT